MHNPFTTAQPPNELKVLPHRILLGESWIEKRTDSRELLPFKFTGKERDSETGLYYYGARYLNPRTARWISPDPAGYDLMNPKREGFSIVEGLGWYSYVANNPLIFTDPTGLEIGTLTSNLKMQSGVGYLGYRGDLISRKGCVATAWSNIVNTILGRRALTPSSFATEYRSLGIQQTAQANKYVSSDERLDMASLVADKTSGLSVISTSENLSETLAALDSLKGKAYVTGSGNLVDGSGNHTINITGVPGAGGTLPFQGTSDYDATRSYSFGPSDLETNTTQITKLTFALPTSEAKAFVTALKNEIEKSAQEKAKEK